ncbi:thiamine transport system ATP-binding protein [Desulfobotulus alkaliphilus]|uniref:Thiamine transport system ATP-binding protein n=1 Tax=Desulfobotulus alkaliphilus TaxID=622671 RepID=A0A562S2M3_9BACT|nr:ABC transporter ATP-binding protein [Desulfobotulus alkaliphilus]TWI75637.1 thiamine transport system ATP-binding protein [Desulfobotulus alkaliphilus]
MKCLLEVENIEKWHGLLKTLDGISLCLGEGEILTLLGPSGGGKTTLLRILAGLEAPDRGRVCLDGRDLAPVEPHRRGVGLVFQDAALFPHLNVEANVAFGLRMAGMKKRERQHRVFEMLELVGLSGLEKRRVDGLSGGERQRVALARSLAPSPKLLLLDEPLGALDRNLRERLARDLRTILKKQQLTAVFVTHDQEEAFSLGDRIAVLLDGRLERMDTPEALSAYPGSPAVARFLGEPNVFTLKDLPAAFRGLFGDSSEETAVLIRPEGIVLRPLIPVDGEAGPFPVLASGEKDAAFLSAHVKERRFFGAFFRVELDFGGGFVLTARLPVSMVPPDEGARVGVALKEGMFFALNDVQKDR